MSRLKELRKYVYKELFKIFVPDYKINLVAPYNMRDDDFEKFETTLAKALKFIK